LTRAFFDLTPDFFDLKQKNLKNWDFWGNFPDPVVADQTQPEQQKK